MAARARRAVQLAAALAPLLLARADRPWRRISRATVWLGAAVLVLWGGANTVVGTLVPAGVIVPAGGYDRAAMIGHAWLWDPLSLLWGLCLLAGLVVGRGRAHGGGHRTLR